MAAQPPAPSSSRRSRDAGQTDLVVGHFKIQLEIGKGSFATVYRAIHVKNRSLVAVKSVHLQKLNKKLKENLYSEIDILKGLHHPHIVALIDCHESTAHIHLVMEFCQLGDLSYFIRKRERLATHPATSDMIKKYPSPPGGALNEVIVRHFLKQLASALEFLRAKNFIHRDVKPQNLLLNPSPLFLAKEQGDLLYAASEKSLVPIVGVESLPMLKIADFGFARSLPSTSLAETLCGSPLYMAPEILRYEKYDAKADLWSVGTVLYEMMTGRPPFKAANHVELLRKIERQDDRIAYPEGLALSNGMERLIKGLLKRNPVQRIGFKDFFDHPVVKEAIPGLVGEDRPREMVPPAREPEHSSSGRQNSSFSWESKVGGADGGARADGAAAQASQPSRDRAPRNKAPSSGSAEPPQSPISHVSGTPPRLSAESRGFSSNAVKPPLPNRDQHSRDQVPRVKRPSAISHATAPARQDLHQDRTASAAAAAMERQTSRNSASPGSSFLVQKHRERDRNQDKQRNDDLSSKEVREKADQEIAFERDYVVVEKRAVEVNAFADELAASPQIHGAYPSASPHHGALARRATTQGTPSSTTGAHVNPSRAIQIATAKQRPELYHQRKSSYERKYGMSPGSATSAISKALNMANFRLFGVGFSPPLIGKGGQSPPQGYGAFPAYPTSQGSLVMIGDGSKTSKPQDEDSRAVQIIEESATRSDVVYGFAEVKYKQLVPLAPSMDRGLGLRTTGIGDRNSGPDHETAAAVEEEGLTTDAIVILSEEALVLYVKALSLLAKSMDLARAWWERKYRGEVLGESSSARPEISTATVATGNRINNVVQWVRSRFNEVLEKAEFVTLKLVHAQKQLPTNHPGHPSNRSSVSSSSNRMGSSVETVSVSTGVTAEKLMYERALEMSRAAAVNELVGEDLAGCEIAYITAVRMLEAVLEKDDTPQKNTNAGEIGGAESGPADSAMNGMQAEDMKIVEKLVASMRARLVALRKKITLMTKRQSIQQPISTSAAAKPTSAPTPTAPTIATTPPR
ncbi:MAG: Serine/threonine-protein kinase [Sclerophora amabilis]|nr:MAG: Serine/threonine-protein kinase [Sclerophora amabilis]